MTEEILRFIHGECSDTERAALLARAERDANFAREIQEARDFDEFLKSEFELVKKLEPSRLAARPHARKSARKRPFIYEALRLALPIAALAVFGLAVYSLFLESKNAPGYNPELGSHYAPIVIDLSKFAKKDAGTYSSDALHLRTLSVDAPEFKPVENMEFSPEFGGEIALLAPEKGPSECFSWGRSAVSGGHAGLPAFSEADEVGDFERALAEFERELGAKAKREAPIETVALSLQNSAALSEAQRASSPAVISSENPDLRALLNKILTDSPNAQNFKRADAFLKREFALYKSVEALNLLSEIHSDSRNKKRDENLAKRCKKLCEMSKQRGRGL